MASIFWCSSIAVHLDLQCGGRYAGKMRPPSSVRECLPWAWPPLTEILADNGTAFTSEQFRKFPNSWGIHFRFWCAYVPSRNGIIKQNHRTVKTIAARKDCMVSEVVYWYNVTPKDDVSPSTAPADALHRYHVRVKGIETNPLPEREVSGERIKEGDVVWVKKTCSKCTTQYGTGHVTKMIRP